MTRGREVTTARFEPWPHGYCESRVCYGTRRARWWDRRTGFILCGTCKRQIEKAEGT